ncbi:MAG: aminotransferase class III-fold pyridoxal phosphate-dependent enzyme, partial [Fibrobacter sp.]|nr:aminotransferase class III-fold pyridoxal phosphate-dependent enzyme [Fibrobacter sp.]
IFDEFKGDFKDSDRTFSHGHTFTGNPLASAAACAALKLFTEKNIPQSLDKIINLFNIGISRFNKFDIVGDVRSLGMIGAIELVKDRSSKERLPANLRFAHKVANKALQHGLLIRPLGDIIYFMPSFIITEEQIEEMFFLTETALKETIDENISDLR